MAFSINGTGDHELIKLALHRSIIAVLYGNKIKSGFGIV
jgi:hypothetical protein